MSLRLYEIGYESESFQEEDSHNIQMLLEFNNEWLMISYKYPLSDDKWIEGVHTYEGEPDIYSYLICHGDVCPELYEELKQNGRVAEWLNATVC